jgi:hypothetical protein
MVLPAALHSQQPDITDCSAKWSDIMLRPPLCFDAVYAQEVKWLDHVQQAINEHPDPLTAFDLDISWSAFHATSSTIVNECDVSITSLLPLFTEDSKSVAMLRHSMDLILASVNSLNGDQISVCFV